MFKMTIQSSNEESQKPKEQEVIPLFTIEKAEVGAEELFGRGFTYRHDWGNRRGHWILNLTWSGVINLNTRIFVSATEFNRANGEALVGSANYTVFNVAPYNGGVRVWVNINWSSDIPIRLDYLIINP